MTSKRRELLDMWNDLLASINQHISEILSELQETNTAIRELLYEMEDCDEHDAD